MDQRTDDIASSKVVVTHAERSAGLHSLVDVYGDRQQTTHLFLWFLGLIVLSLIAGIFIVLSANDTLVAVLIGMSTLPTLAVYFLFRRRSLEWMALLLGIGLITLLTVVATNDLGIHHISNAGYPSVLIIVSLVVGRRAMIFVTLYTIGCVAWLVFGELSGAFTPKTLERSVPGDFVSISIILILTAVMARVLAETLMNTNRLLNQELKERKQAEAQVIELAKEKGRASIMASLVREMAHDFRTPLSTMATRIYLLQQSPNSDQQAQHLNVLSAQVNRLANLLESVLYMAQLDSGVAFDYKSVELIRVIRDIHTRVTTVSMAAKNLNWDLDLPANEILVWADEKRLHHALLEIVDNAIEYTSSGGTIRIRAWSQPDLAVVEVQDTGKGMSQDTLGRIFDRFYKGDESRSDMTGGSGLGLSIARKIVELNGGQIQVTSILGQGSTFRIQLPLRQNQQSLGGT